MYVVKSELQIKFVTITNSFWSLCQDNSRMELDALKITIIHCKFFNLVITGTSVYMHVILVIIFIKIQLYLKLCMECV